MKRENPFELLRTRCPISGQYNDAIEIYPANFDFSAFNPAVFSARRLPDRVHYRIVKSRSSGLVRSDPIAPPEFFQGLYRRSTFGYGAEVKNLKKTYGFYLGKLQAFRASRDRLCEIGCGNGFFLEEALTQGFKEVWGLELSRDAITQAQPDIRERILCDVLRPGLFPKAFFSVICMFQVFDHIDDPNGVLKECIHALRPGGMILCLNHNVESFSARLLGEKSPIIDIEHLFFYSPRTMEAIFRMNGFDVKEVGSAWNVFSIFYLAKLFPLPKAIKLFLLNRLQSGVIGRLSLKVPAGNLFLIAKKPE